MSDNEFYDSIARDLSGGAIRDTRSETLQFILTFLEAGMPERALELVPKLNETEYERNRIEIAKQAGIRSTALDHLRKGNADDKKQGRSLSLPEPVPATEPQDGAQLLDDVARQIRRFIVADETSIDAISLWIVFAHVAQKAAVNPILCFSSAVKSCGKSTALDVVSRLVPKPLAISNISVAALFRTVELLEPTLLVDEADSMFKNNDDLRTLTNSGFTRTAAQVVRIVGDDLEPRLFNVFCPKAIALIGMLPDTVESRSICVRMRRKLSDEKVERLRSDRDQGFAPLLSRIARWTMDNAEMILGKEPEIDASLSDRQADCWRELLRIADAAGGDWPQCARTAALELCAKQSDEGDLSVRLLADIQKIFTEQNDRTKWPAKALTDALNALDDSPWAEYGSHGLSTNRLARMLSRFDIRGEVKKEAGKTFRGYTTNQFEDVFARYLQKKCRSVTFGDNSLQDNSLQGYTLGYGYTLKCNPEPDTPDAKEGAMAEDGFTSEQLQIVDNTLTVLLQADRVRTGKESAGLCVANWRLSCAARGVPFEAFDAAKAYFDQLGVYEQRKGIVYVAAPPEDPEPELEIF